MKPFNQDFFNKMAFEFDSHVRQSIPLYDSVQRFIVQAISTGKAQTVLDLLGSTGAVGRALHRANWGGGYLCVDGSPKMQQAFYSLRPFDAYGLSFELAGFLDSWTDKDSVGNDVVVPMYCNYKKFDVVLELLGFQFFTQTRDKEVAAAAACMNAGGCFITFEKFGAPKGYTYNADGTIYDGEIWNANELLKDTYHKALYFDSAQIEEKKKAVLDDMGDYLVTQEGYNYTLKRHFKHVLKFAQIGNFAGYICANDYSNDIYQYMSNEVTSGYFELIQNGFNYPTTKARILAPNGFLI